ncbi:MAG: ornithine--oxo-acid transaminase [Candidatus Sericytochromatia bacterium]|uniref:ornithine aminotransferase n=1 Tax=Candidatus Tanganyikabacteria bacterium TaxID=2961651 RepID=A0A937X6M6_9BACT|nr:ornithine--oxo-acid transaminase [Candidatus Tanganyikabacteria bacterium]
MIAETSVSLGSKALMSLEDELGAHNYHPLGLVISEAHGAWVTDLEGKRYLDCLSAYSAVNQGHAHPRILEALIEQAKRVTLTSRAFHNDKLGLFYKKLADLTGMDKVLPMNSGTEAVETAIKAARKWGYQVKGIPADQAEIVVCSDNFHGRTTTIVSFSTEPLYKDQYGPYTPGFKIIPYGDAKALEAALTPNTCAFLVEPLQGEAGVRVPPEGFLREAARLCRERNVLLMLDEIQTGLGRTGKMFCFEHEGIRPDVLILGKALSGGYYPVSAVASRKDVLGVFTPGSHGSTFGGNPLGCAVAMAALDVLVEERLVERAEALGNAAFAKLRAKVASPHVVEIRGKGLMVGVELDVPARPYCEALFNRGVLCKETHDKVIRFAPPLVISEADLDWALDQLVAVLNS